MDPKDEKMKLFNKHLNRVLVEMNSEDYYLQHKYRVYNAAEKAKNLERSTQRAVRLMREMEEEKKPVVATQLIDENVVNLTNQLKELVQAGGSPIKNVKSNKKLLFVPEDTSEESLDSNDDSYDRKMEERKKKKRKKEKEQQSLGLKKNLRPERNRARGQSMA